MDMLIFVLLAATLFLWMYILLNLLFSRALATRRRLDEVRQLASDDASDLDLSVLTGAGLTDANALNVPLLGSYLQRITLKLSKAHVMIKPAEFILVSLVTALLAALIVFAINRQVWLALLFGVIGYLLPSLALASSSNKRAKQLNSQLPEFLNVLSNALRSGLSFNQSISAASNELDDPIRWEFQKVLRDNNLGKPMEVALLDMVKRTGDDDIELFVTAVNIQRQTGGNLSEVLDLIANTIRERVRLKGEVNTMTAQGKMSAVIISLLPIALMIVISLLSPEFMAPLFSEPIGRIMLIVAGVMMLLGGLMLKKITTLEV